MSTTSDYEEDSDRGYGLPDAQSDGETELKRKYDLAIMEIEELKAAEVKRKKRKSKKTVKGPSVKRLSNIPKEGQLDDSSTYIIGKMTRRVLWKNMKYFNEVYTDDCLKVFYKRLGLTNNQQKETFSDHIIYYIDQKLTTCRNNAIYMMKKLVMADHNGELNVPIGYNTWHEAIRKFMEARMNPSITPDDVNINDWNTFEIIACKIMPKICRKYKTEEDRANCDYHDAVTASDEAFVWQLMTFYYPSWAALKGNATEVEQDDEENSVTRKTTPGPKKGFTDTAGKTVAKYNEYVYLMGESRKGPNAKLWSDRLKLATLKNLDPKKNTTGTGYSAVVTSKMPSMDWLQYTKLDLCAMDDDDNGIPGLSIVGATFQA